MAQDVKKGEVKKPEGEVKPPEVKPEVEERKPERKTSTTKVEYTCELDGKKFESYKDLITHVRYNYRMPVYAYFAILSERRLPFSQLPYSLYYLI